MRFRRIYRDRPQRLQLYDVPELTRDSYGQPSTAGNLLVTLYGAVRMLRGEEQLNVRQQWPTATHLVTTRWTGAAISAGPNNPFGLILERMYLIIVLDNSRLNILNANNMDKRNVNWLLTCEEKRQV